MRRYKVTYRVRVLLDIDDDLFRDLQKSQDLDETATAIFLASTMGLDDIPLNHIKGYDGLPASAGQVTLQTDVLTVERLDDDTSVSS